MENVQLEPFTMIILNWTFVGSLSCGQLCSRTISDSCKLGGYEAIKKQPKAWIWYWQPEPCGFESGRDSVQEFETVPHTGPVWKGGVDSSFIGTALGKKKARGHYIVDGTRNPTGTVVNCQSVFFNLTWLTQYIRSALKCSYASTYKELLHPKARNAWAGMYFRCC